MPRVTQLPGPRQEEGQVGLENQKDEPLSPSCLSPVSGLVPGKCQVPPATPRECLFSRPLACPSCPTGLPVP